jgi:hypothetical protein
MSNSPSLVQLAEALSISDWIFLLQLLGTLLTVIGVYGCIRTYLDTNLFGPVLGWGWYGRWNKELTEYSGGEELFKDRQRVIMYTWYTFVIVGCLCWILPFFL